MCKAITAGPWDAIPSPPTPITDDLKAAVDELEANAAELDTAVNPALLKKLKHELTELEDGELLAKLETDARTFIASKKRESDLRICAKACDTTAITRLGSELM